MHSIRESRRGINTVSTTAATKDRRPGYGSSPRRDQRRGVTLIEVMLAVLILVIVLIGTSSTYVTGRQYIVNQRYYRTAAQLASQKLEELKATSYDNINTGEVVEALSVDGLAYQRHTQTELTATPTTEVPKPCKKATVTIVWSLAGNQHQARLITYIGP